MFGYWHLLTYRDYGFGKVHKMELLDVKLVKHQGDDYLLFECLDGKMRSGKVKLDYNLIDCGECDMPDLLIGAFSDLIIEAYPERFMGEKEIKKLEATKGGANGNDPGDEHSED